MKLEQLKAQAYDAVVQIEQWQLKLRELNRQIAEYKPEDKKDAVQEGGE